MGNYKDTHKFSMIFLTNQSNIKIVFRVKKKMLWFNTTNEIFRPNSLFMCTICASCYNKTFDLSITCQWFIWENICWLEIDIKTKCLFILACFFCFVLLKMLPGNRALNCFCLDIPTTLTFFRPVL